MNHAPRARTTAKAARSGLTPAEIAIVSFLILLLMAAVLLTGQGVGDPVSTTRVKVRPGDTLWALAARFPVEGRTTEQTADLLIRINGLDGSTIIAGQTLEVPAHAARDSLLALR